MTMHGTIRGAVIELEKPTPYPDGTPVDVTVTLCAARPGSPAAVLSLAGTLSTEEAAIIRDAATEARKIDNDLWGRGPV